MRRLWYCRVEEPNNIYNCIFSAQSLALWVNFSDGTTEQHIIIAGSGELAAVD